MNCNFSRIKLDIPDKPFALIFDSFPFLRDNFDYVHTGPDEFETVLKFVRLQLFTRNRTNYRPKSVHTEPDEFVAEIILY